MGIHDKQFELTEEESALLSKFLDKTFPDDGAGEWEERHINAVWKLVCEQRKAIQDFITDWYDCLPFTDELNKKLVYRLEEFLE